MHRADRVAAGGISELLHSLGSAGSLSDGDLLERFLDGQDPLAAQAAFRVLVERHGPMVLTVCQQRLGDADDAQDAFQATFLLLVRKARFIRQRGALGGWLLVTARRVAERARTSAARRREVEHTLALGMQLQADQQPASTCGAGLDTSCSALHEEIERLPWRFRDPLWLHYFEGQTAEAIRAPPGLSSGDRAVSPGQGTQPAQEAARAKGHRARSLAQCRWVWASDVLRAHPASSGRNHDSVR